MNRIVSLGIQILSSSFASDDDFGSILMNTRTCDYAWFYCTWFDNNFFLFLWRDDIYPFVEFVFTSHMHCKPPRSSITWFYILHYVIGQILFSVEHFFTFHLEICHHETSCACPSYPDARLLRVLTTWCRCTILQYGVLIFENSSRSTYVRRHCHDNYSNKHCHFR